MPTDDSHALAHAGRTTAQMRERGEHRATVTSLDSGRTWHAWCWVDGWEGPSRGDYNAARHDGDAHSAAPAQ